jgi:hypothetical protein
LAAVVDGVGAGAEVVVGAGALPPPQAASAIAANRLASALSFMAKSF